MLDEFVALDLETTGLSVESDLIIEVGATRFDRSGCYENYRTFVNPGRSIPIEVQELTGISNADIANAPRFSEVRDEVRAFIGDLPIVGQNIAFDIAFLDAERVRSHVSNDGGPPEPGEDRGGARHCDAGGAPRARGRGGDAGHLPGAAREA